MPAILSPRGATVLESSSPKYFNCSMGNLTVDQIELIDPSSIRHSDGAK